MIRVGQGFDVHPLVLGRPFLLGGVSIAWSKGPQGHSDGDVLLHAVIDALLGAAGLGDIGEWFPSSDASLGGADSASLLRQVVQCIHDRGYDIHNADVTVLLEEPALSPYKASIRQRLAALLDVEPSLVNIKAKTFEGFGPIGDGEAVAAIACVVIESQ